MAWCRPGDKPLSEPMMAKLMTHICSTRGRWVNIWSYIVESDIWIFWWLFITDLHLSCWFHISTPNIGSHSLKCYNSNDAAEPTIDMQKWVEVRRQLHLQYISSLNKAADLLIYIQYLSMDLGGCKRGWGKYRGQKQVYWTWMSNYNHCVVWNVIIYPCTKYLLLAHTSANMTLDFHNL